MSGRPRRLASGERTTRVSRGQVTVREAEVLDAPALAQLWAEFLVRPSGEGSELDDRARVVEAVARHSDHVDTRILVAEVEGVVAGAAYLRVGLTSPLDAEPVLHVSHLKVSGDFSTPLLGEALLEGAVSWAEERGIGTVLAGSTTTDRETNRFLARLGLGQVGVLRATAVPALRARLLRDSTSGRLGRATRRTGQVVAARRSQRRSRAGDLAL
jgi:N-acetylglutamate synthase-like GNAT family acetyltransferase